MAGKECPFENLFLNYSDKIIPNLGIPYCRQEISPAGLRGLFASHPIPQGHVLFVEETPLSFALSTEALKANYCRNCLVSIHPFPALIKCMNCQSVVFCSTQCQVHITMVRTLLRLNLRVPRMKK